MENSKRVKRHKFLTLALAVLVIGIIAASLIYRGTITSRITGDVTGNREKVLTEAEAATILLNYLNTKYGDAKFFRSEDLGSIYLVIVEHDKQQYTFFVTKDGEYFSNMMEKIEVAEMGSSNVNESNLSG